MERWLKIKDFEQYYSVSDHGRVYSARSDLILKCTPDRDGYPCAQLKVNGSVSQFRVNRLVALMFIPNPENLPEVHHKNHIRNDNNVDNLEWVTTQRNIEASLAKSYKILSPDGELVEFFNLRQFCRDNELDVANFHKVIVGKKKSCKGWRTYITE